jgi:hypothetical protein
MMERPTKKRESKRQLVIRKLEAKAEATPHAPEAEAFRAKAKELKIHCEHVQTSPIVEGRDHGAITIGYWFLENGDTVVVCDGDGTPRHHRAVQNHVKLLPDQTAKQVARRLIKDMHGEAPSGGFWRELRYPSGRAPV